MVFYKFYRFCKFYRIQFGKTQFNGMFTIWSTDKERCILKFSVYGHTSSWNSPFDLKWSLLSTYLFDCLCKPEICAWLFSDLKSLLSRLNRFNSCSVVSLLSRLYLFSSCSVVSLLYRLNLFSSCSVVSLLSRLYLFRSCSAVSLLSRLYLFSSSPVVSLLKRLYLFSSCSAVFRLSRLTLFSSCSSSASLLNLLYLESKCDTVKPEFCTNSFLSTSIENSFCQKLMKSGKPIGD